MGGGGGGIIKAVIGGAILGALTGGIGFGLQFTTGPAVFGLEAGLWSAVASGAAMGALGGTLSGVAGALMGGGALDDAGSIQYEAQDRTHSVSQAISYRRIIYGRVRVAGVRTFVEESADNQTLHVVYTIAAHEVDAFEQFWLGNEIVTVNEDGSVNGAWADHVEVYYGYGSTSGDATFHEKLRANAPGKWTENHLQKGCAKVYVKFSYDSDLFASGIPNPSWVVRGRKVYDPRTETTAWSDNATLCQRDYLVTYWKWPLSLINDDDVIASANIDDEDVPTNSVVMISQTAGTAIGSMTGGEGLDAAFNGSDDVEFEDCATASGSGTIGKDWGEDVTKTIAGIRFYGSLDDGIADSAASFTWSVEASTDGSTWVTIREPVTVTDAAAIVVEAFDGFDTATAYRHVHLVLSAGSGSVGVAELRFYEMPGTEKRYTCNGTLQTDSDHGTSMTKLLSANRGWLVESGGKYRLLSAAWRTPHSRVLTIDDLDGPLSLEPRLSRTDLFNTVTGIFVNPANYWQAEDFAAVKSDFYRTMDGPQAVVTTVNVSASTLTLDADDLESGQAVRFFNADDMLPGGLSADTVYYIGLTTVDGDIVPGVVSLTDADGEAIVLTSAGSGTTIANLGKEIDKPVEFPFTTSNATCQRIGKLDLLCCRQQQAVNWPGKLTCFPYRVGDIIPVTIERYGWTEKLFQVERWSPTGRGGTEEDDPPRLGIDMRLREIDESCFDWNTSEEQLSDPAPDTNLPKARSVLRPSSLALESGTDHLLVLGDGTVISRLYVSWTDPDTALLRVDVQYKPVDDAAWIDAPPVLPGVEAAYLSPVVDGVAYVVRVRSVNNAGASSKWRESDQHIVVGKSQPPADLVVFTVNDGIARWEAEAEKDYDGVEIRYHIGVNRSFATALALHQGRLKSSPYTLPSLPGGVVTILAKGFDTSGNENVAASSVVLNLGDALVANVVEEFDQAALDWPGTIINGSIAEDGSLVADDAGGLVWDENPGRLAWTNDAAPAWTGSWKAMTYEVEIEFTLAVAADTIKMPLAVEGDSTIVEVRRPSAALAWSNDANYAWTNDDAQAWSSEPWEPWTGDMPARPGTWRFRVTTGFGSTQGRIVSMIPTLDGADITEVLPAVSLDPAGTRLPVANAYRAIKVVNCTLLGGTATTVRALDKDASGPLVRADDSSGDGIAATINATIQGY